MDNKQIGWSTEAKLLHRISKELERLAGIVATSGGGGGGSTNLTYTPSPTGGSMQSGTGTPAPLTLANGTNAGLLPPADYSRLQTAPVTTILVLSTPASSTSTTRATVPGWTFPVTAGKKYKIEIIATYQTAATTTGGSIGVTLSTGSGLIMGILGGEIVITTAATGLRTTISVINNANTQPNSFVTTTGLASVGSPAYLGGTMFFQCTASGVFEVQWATEVAASAAQINDGSTMIVSEY